MAGSAMTGPLATLLRSRSIASHAIAAARWCHQSVEEDTVSGISLTKLFLGFAAGAIAVVTAHKIIDYVLYTAGIFPRVRWSISPAAITGVPQIVSDAFWGGLWGVLFALITVRVPVAI